MKSIETARLIEIFDLGELYVIVEYCRFGNLQAFLMNHRKTFLNLVDDSGMVNSAVDVEEGLKPINE